MVQGTSKKQKIKPGSEKTLISIFFKALLACINFFISIGEGTRVILTTPLRIAEPIKKIGRRIRYSYNHTVFRIKTQLALKNAKHKKIHKKDVLVVSAPVAAQISAKRRKQKSKTSKSVRFSNFHFPKLRVPRISFPRLHFPTFRFVPTYLSTISLSKKTQKKTYTKLKIAKSTKSSRKLKTSPRFLIFLKKFFLFIIKKIVFLIVFVFNSIWNGIVLLLTFILFLIKKPFEFLNTLLTAQLRFFLFGVLLCAIFFVSREFNQFVTSLPSPREIGKVNYSLATQLNDRNGKLLYEIYRDEKRTPVDISKLPKYVPEASIAIEDKDFYQHKGVSLVSGILRAGKETLFKGDLQGGSTITQQLVKTSLLTPERTITRKVKEIILALWTEQMYSKSQILQMYMNQVPYGGAAYGIQEAAKTYFGKDAKDLTIAEAALLGGLPQAPSDYSPFVNPNLALNRRNSVLEKMKEQKYITQSEYQAALETPVEIIKPEVSIKAPHFVFYVKDQLENEYGTRMVEEGGLKVTTTLDLDMQQHVQQIVQDEINKQSYLNVTNGAVLVANPKTGEILAMVGSTDYFKDPNGAFNVTTAARQPGSSLKPLLYSLALQKGFTAASIINDAPTTFNVPGAESYHPGNYDGKFHGPVTMRIALANSYNIPAVKTLYDVGIQNFVSYMQNLGITTWNDPGRYVLPMAIGGVETKMVDEVTAYTALADLGQKASLSGVKKVTDSNDAAVQNQQTPPVQAMSPGAAYIITDILSDNQARTLTFGPGSTLEIPGYKVAVKTGTTDSKKDNWAFGYTPEFLVGVWIGNNDNTPMSPAIESGATGASSLWHRVMEYLLKNKAQNPNGWYAKPDDVVQKICGGRPEYFIAGTENAVNCVPTPVPQKQNSTQPIPTQIPGQQITPAQITPFQINNQRKENGNGNNKNRYNSTFNY